MLQVEALMIIVPNVHDLHLTIDHEMIRIDLNRPTTSLSAMMRLLLSQITTIITVHLHPLCDEIMRREETMGRPEVIVIPIKVMMVEQVVNAVDIEAVQVLD